MKMGKPSVILFGLRERRKRETNSRHRRKEQGSEARRRGRDRRKDLKGSQHVVTFRRACDLKIPCPREENTGGLRKKRRHQDRKNTTRGKDMMGRCLWPIEEKTSEKM